MPSGSCITDHATAPLGAHMGSECSVRHARHQPLHACHTHPSAPVPPQAEAACRGQPPHAWRLGRQQTAPGGIVGREAAWDRWLVEARVAHVRGCGGSASRGVFHLARAAPCAAATGAPPTKQPSLTFAELSLIHSTNLGPARQQGGGGGARFGVFSWDGCEAREQQRWRQPRAARPAPPIQHQQARSMACQPPLPPPPPPPHPPHPP